MKQRRGYTLLEIILVVVMIAIITATAMPKVDYQAWRQDAAARAVRGAMMQAQAYAVSSQHNVFVLPDMVHGNKLYVVYDYNDNLALDANEHWIAVPLQDGAIIKQPPVALPGGAPANGLSVPASTPPIQLTVPGSMTTSQVGWVFRSDGAVSSAAQIYIGTSRGLAKDFRAVSLTQATGRCDWWKLVNNTWVREGF
ncbi:MAG TPA: type II secretion system protein [Gemmatimonadaceae bacterium]|nr:type II secretion system protein [Gemmatimonadaceae bacterium]